MAEQNVARKTEAGEGEIVTRLGRGAYRIASFTEPGTFYEVNPYEGTCNHPYAYRQTAPCKHVVLCEAILAARALRFGSRIAEERVTEMCRRIYAPLKKEGCIPSYKLLLEVTSSRYSTEAMEDAVRRRHGRALLLHENSSGKVA